MIETATGRHRAVRNVIRALTVFNAVTFLFASASHLGEPIPLGLTTVEEPQIVPATIVEGLSGIFFAVSAYSLFTHKEWRWLATTSSHVFALVGVLIGITALRFGGGQRTDLNDAYHLIMLVVLIVGLVLLFSARGKAALGHGDHASKET